MAITRKKKEEILTKITEAMKNAASAVFIGFKRLTVAEVTALRSELKKDGVRYMVLKKTLLKKALAAKAPSGTLPELPGEVAVVYLENGDDITAPARGIQGSMKKLKEKLVFLGGVLEGKYLSMGEVVQIATIPPIPVLRGMFVNVINSPLQRFAIALGEVTKKKV